MKIGMRLMATVATTVFVASVSACGGGQDDTVTPATQKAPVVELTAPTTDSAAAEAAAKAQADAAAAAKAAAEAEAKAVAEAEAQAAAEAEAQAAAAVAEAESEAVFYENCTAVRAAGADPIHRGEPGYSTKLDRDRDGIACE